MKMKGENTHIHTQKENVDMISNNNMHNYQKRPIQLYCLCQLFSWVKLHFLHNFNHNDLQSLTHNINQYHEQKLKNEGLARWLTRKKALATKPESLNLIQGNYTKVEGEK